MANDGIVAFVAAASTLSDEPDSLICRSGASCSRAYVHAPGVGTRRILLDGSLLLATAPPRFPGESPVITDLDIDASGRWIAVIGRIHVSLTGYHVETVLYDRFTQRTVSVHSMVNDPLTPRPSVSGNGPRDADRDSLADDWETAVGLDPATAADAPLDSDGDGLTNLQEFQAGSHPKGTATRYLAEGAANAFFTTRLALFNPTAAPTGVVLRFLGGGGEVSSYTTTLNARAREVLTLTSTSNIPANDFSTVVESTEPIVVERTMTWDGSGYGAHAETAGDAPARNWYLAEGATHGAFDLFYLLQNPNTEDATVTITYLRPTPRTPVVKTYTVTAHSRRTIWVDDEGPALEAEDIAARIEANRPILVERALYASTPTQPFAAGHAGAGIAAPALQWFFAEGATGPLFDLYLLIGNPGSADANVRVTYLRSDGEPIAKSYAVAAAARLTIGVNGEARDWRTPSSR